MFCKPQDLLLMMGIEILKIDASWAEKLRKTRVPFLMTPTVWPKQKNPWGFKSPSVPAVSSVWCWCQCRRWPPRCWARPSGRPRRGSTPSRTSGTAGEPANHNTRPVTWPRAHLWLAGSSTSSGRRRPTWWGGRRTPTTSTPPTSSGLTSGLSGTR